MKTIKLLIVLLLLSLTADSQVFLGHTEQQLKKEHPELRKIDTEGFKGLRADVPNLGIIAYIMQDNYSKEAMFFPILPIHDWIKRYNEIAVIISSTHWKSYSNGTVTDVHLIYSDDIYYFYYTLSF